MTTKNVIKTPAAVAQLGAILFVSAHPDDDMFTAGGIMAAATKNGQRVQCLAATRGDAGTRPGWPQDMIAEIRTQEQNASMRILGVKEQVWLPYRDSFLDEVDTAEAVEKLRQAVNAFRPDSILTFGPDGLTGHPDHQAVSRWVSELKPAAQVYWAVIEPEQHDQLKLVDWKANIFFNTKQPPLVKSADCAIDLKLTPELTKLKKRAFEAVPSQMETILAMKPFARPGEGLARECFVKATK
jgi:LmbE family N-acetylglucosaminyl deacetylase